MSMENFIAKAIEEEVEKEGAGAEPLEAEEFKTIKRKFSAKRKSSAHDYSPVLEKLEEMSRSKKNKDDKKRAA